MFERLRDWIGRTVRKMFPVASVEKAFDIKLSKDTIMSHCVQLWSDMYSNKPPWVSDTVTSMSLPSSIANEMARLVTLELDTSVGGSARADYLNDQYQEVMKDIRKYCEYGCAKGGLIFKPYLENGNIGIDYVQADSFYPVRFSSSGKITAAVFSDSKQIGEKIYTRLEYHDYSPSQKKETIINKCYMSTIKDSLGNEVRLQSVDDWEYLQPVAYVENIEKPTYAYFKVPIANSQDTSSPLGSSIFARAVDLIKEADKQYSRLLWEFESAERAVDIDLTAIKRDAQGNDLIPERKQRLFRKLDMEGRGGESFYEVFSPQIRDESHLSGLNEMLRLIEFNCGLAYGTLSNAEIDAKTATEIKQTRQRSYATVTDIQKSLQSALEDLVYIMDVYATLYSLAPSGKYETSFKWDDSIIVDAEAERLRDLQEMRDGIMSRAQYRMKWYGEDEATAKAKIQEAQGESQTDDDLLGFNK